MVLQSVISMRWLSWILCALLAGYFGFVIYANRALYFSTFDQAYWKDKYEHSQWKLPLSERVLGDDGLYLYEGYRLIQGDDPTTLNAEVPPLAKYLIGISIKVFGNGYVYGLIATTAALVCVFILTRLLTKNTTMSLMTTLLVALDPLISKQFILTMLDGLHLTFLLLSLIGTILLIETRNKRWSWAWAAGSGATLGLFAEVKFPLFAPFIGIVLLWTIWNKTKDKTCLLAFVLSAGIAYIIPYVPYFFMGHTLTEWLGVQKWIVMFFARSGLTPTFGSIVTTLLFNRNQNLFSREFLPVPEWSPAWPVITVLGVSGLLGACRTRQTRQLYLPVGIIVFFLLGFNLLVPFWTRYLVGILPFLYLGALHLIQRLPKKLGTLIILALLVVNATAAAHAVIPSPQATISQFLADWEHGFFQDMYEATAETTRQSITHADFHRFGRKLWYDAQIESARAAVQPYRFSLLASQHKIPIVMTYKTRNLGDFSVSRTIPLIREQGAWKIAWNWELLFPGLTPSSTAETAVEPARRGGLFAEDGVPLAYDRESILVWLDPTKVDSSRENELFLALESLFDKKIKAVHFHERYVRLGELGLPVPMGVLMHTMDDTAKTLLTSFPALSTTPAFGRITLATNRYAVGSVKNTLYEECCSLLYTTSSYEGVDGLERDYNDTLKGENGGTLMLKDADGTTIETLIQKTKRDGENVRLTK